MIPYDSKDAATVWQEGTYDATLLDSEETVSKNGNPMYKLTIGAYQGEKEMRVYEYAVIPSMLWKIHKLARALGQLDAFKANKFDPREWIGHGFQVRLDIKDDPKYGEQNIVADYLPKGTTEWTKPKAPVVPTSGDDEPLPF